MITYVDTSTIIALIIDEPGSAAAEAVWDQSHVLASARILYVEARAALAAAQRAGRITTRQLAASRASLDELWGQVSIIEIDETLALAAADIAERFQLRGYDAVHLAAAFRVGANIFSSCDRALCRAARGAGMYVNDTGA